MPKLKVLVVGAGIGGLTAALALQRAGAHVTVAEQAPNLGEVGAGVTLTPNVTRVLHHLGLVKDLASILVVPKFQNILHWKTGEVLLRKERGDAALRTYGFPYGYVHRADLHAMLSGAVQANDPSSILLGHKAIGAVTSKKSARVSFENGASIKADVVIGADGVRSAIRDLMFATTPPRFTGHVAWRGLAPTKKLPKKIAETPPGVLIGPGRLFTRYPVRGGDYWNFVAFARQEGWTDESWSARAPASDAIRMFAGWHDIVRETIQAVPRGKMFKWALYARDPLRNWVAGRAVLIGDAAHAMLPFLGQGAAMSVEDAMVLARCLIEISDTDVALGRYHALRKARCDETQKESVAMADRLQAEEAGSYAKGPVRDEETMGYFAYDALSLPLRAPKPATKK